MIVIGIWIATTILVAILCRNKFPEKKELSRKIVHIGTGPVIPLAWWLGIPSESAVPLASLITLLLLINKQLKFLPALEEVKRTSYGTVAYGLSITYLFIFFWPNNAAAMCSGVLIMAFGDGFAGLIGSNFNSPSWNFLGQRKSLLGTMTMGIVAAIILLIVSFANGLDIYPLRILTIAFFALLLEQVGPWGIDNLTVPIGVAYGFNWIINV